MYGQLMETINNAKTAELIIGKMYEDVRTCYQLACIYCLENFVSEFWERLEEDEKSVMLESRLDLVSYWSHVMAKKDMSESIDHHLGDITDTCYAFRDSVESDNLVAVKYFLEKLTDVERDEEIPDAVRTSSPTTDGYYVYYGEKWSVFCFLYLSHLTKEQQSKVHPFSVLINFLQWPYVDRFMSYARTLCW